MLHFSFLGLDINMIRAANADEENRELGELVAPETRPISLIYSYPCRTAVSIAIAQQPHSAVGLITGNIALPLRSLLGAVQFQC